jgi:hypothetical protein
MDPFAVGIFGIGAALFALVTVVGLVSFMRTFGRHPRRKVSLVSLLLLIIGLGCFAALHGTTSIAPRVAGILAGFVVIPMGVIVASAFAASFLEPVVMAVALFLIPLLGDFMPMMSGAQNPLHPPPGAEFGLVFNLLGYTTVLLVPLSAIGFGVLYVSRKVRALQWTWSVLRGLAWRVPCSAGGGVRTQVEIVVRHCVPQ